MIEADQTWVDCDDIDLAAAFGTLGVIISPDVQVRADNGKEMIIFHLSTDSATNPAIKTGYLMRLIKSGELEKVDPENPLLYALQGIKNLHAVRRYIKDAKPLVLLTKKGTTRTAYVKSNVTDAGLAKAERFLSGAQFH